MANIVNDRDVLIMATVPRYTAAANAGMFVNPPSAIFKLSADGRTASPASFAFQATLLNLTGMVTWTWTDGLAPTVNGNEITLDYGNFSAVSGTITATLTVDGEIYAAIATVTKVADGATSYTWIKYADTAAGAGLSDDPTGKTYIGLAYNKTTVTESTTVSDYTWSLIKGADGVAGAKGADGSTLYTWIKYSDVSDGTGLYDTPTASTLYIGIAVNKTTATESSIKTDYVWSKFKGDQGVPGQSITGPQGSRGNVDISVLTAGHVWSDTEAAAGLAAAGYGAPQVRDLVNLYNSDRTFGAQKMFNGQAWVTVDYVWNGNVFVKGSILPESIDTRGLTIRDAAGNIILGSGTGLPTAYAAPGTLNSAIALSSSGELTGAGGGQVTLPGMGQNSYRVVATGSSNSTPTAAPGLYINGAIAYGCNRSYNFVRIRRSDGVVTFFKQYDVFGLGAATGGAKAYDLATDLNATSPDYIVVVWSYDEPQTNRFNDGLATAMYRCGASRAIFGSSQFMYRSAYTLIGIGGCGEGNGAEAYQGSVASDSNAWVDFGFSLSNGMLSVSPNYTPRTLTDYGYTGDLDANNTTNTNQLIDGAGLGTSATGVSISSSGQLIGPAGGGQVETLPVKDGARTIDYAPRDYGVVHVKEFKQCISIGLSTGATWCTLETMKPWVDNTGGNATQWAYVSASEVWKRSGGCGDASWGAWVRDLDRSLYTGDLNATVGATIGVNLGGQMTPQTISTYIAAAAIHLGLIDVASIGSLSALTAVIGLLRTATSGARIEISDNLITGYRANNTMSFKISA